MVLSEDKIEIIEKQINTEKRTVDYDTRDYTIEIIVKKYLEKIEEEENEIFVPEYQREFVWDEEKQSRLIESLILGLPIPSIFLAENKDGRLEIVDGSQRIRTIASFISNDLTLVGLEKLTNINDLIFDQLPISRKRKIQNTAIRIMILSESATEEVKNDLFDRINRGSENLRNMEKRRGIYSGDFTDFIYKECRAIPELSKLTILSKSVEKRQEYEELILRFFAFTDNYPSLGLLSKGVGRALDDYLQEKNYELLDKDPKTTKEQLNNRKKDFEKMLKFVEKAFPLGFSKKEGQAVSRTFFEAISIGTYLALREKPDLTPQKVDINQWLKDKAFSSSVLGRSRTHSISKVKKRIEYVKKQLLN